MLQANPILNQHPLDLWQSPTVTALLVDFYTANFVKAGLAPEFAEQFVLNVWDHKDTADREQLRKHGAKHLRHIKQFITNKPDEPELLGLFDLAHVSTFLDVGANKLTAINYYAEKFPQVKEFIGVDIIPQSKQFVDPRRSRYYEIGAAGESFPVAAGSVDYINIQYVLHHFKDLTTIKTTLHDCAAALKPGGTLVLWEESFGEAYEVASVAKNNAQGLRTDASLTERFYALSTRERWEFILANDWFINVSNVHMPWTGQYYRWSDWVWLLGQYGFTLQRELSLGLRVNGRLRQGVPVIGEFIKSN